MIVVDSSALISIFERELDAAVYALALAKADDIFMSAMNVHETGIVMFSRHGMAGLEKMWIFLKNELEVTIRPFDEKQAQAALIAFQRYGKGTGSPAQLNMADCAAYALAKTLDVPLLFKGNDFSRTDIGACISLP